MTVSVILARFSSKLLYGIVETTVPFKDIVQQCFHFKQAAWPCMISVCVIGCKMKPWKTCTSTSLCSASNSDNMRVTILISPIDCRVRIHHEPNGLLTVIFSHWYIDSKSITLKNVVFLAVYWSFWRSIDYCFINRASTMLNNAFKGGGSHKQSQNVRLDKNNGM